MQKLPPTLPMTEGEKQWMMDIYELRRQDLFSKGWIRCLLQSVLFNVVLLLFVHFGPDERDRQNQQWFIYKVVIIIIGVLMALLRCAVLYFGGILSFKKDAIEGMKQPLPFVIFQKEYFPITGQYFFKYTDDVDTHYEVDKKTYLSYEEGDTIYRYRGVHSMHMLQENDHVQVKFFVWRRDSRFDYTA